MTASNFRLLCLSLLFAVAFAPRFYGQETLEPETNSSSDAAVEQLLQHYSTASESVVEEDAAKGVAAAQFQLGIRAKKSGDDATALKWYRKAAGQDFALAEFNLGVVYAHGHGVAKNNREAMEWFKKSAEHGFAKAQIELGVAHLNGLGGKKDYAEAMEWFKKAAEKKNAEAQFNIGFMYANGIGVPVDQQKAVQWYQEAAEQNYADAQNNLGLMYSNGTGVEKNDELAVQWYRRQLCKTMRWLRASLPICTAWAEASMKTLIRRSSGGKNLQHKIMLRHSTTLALPTSWVTAWKRTKVKQANG